jgi:hypothetical protein
MGKKKKKKLCFYPTPYWEDGWRCSKGVSFLDAPTSGEMIHLTVWYILQPPTDRATDRPVDCRSLFWVKDDDVAVKSIEGSLLVKLIIMSWTHETPISFGSVLQIDTLGLNRTGLH